MKKCLKYLILLLMAAICYDVDCQSDISSEHCSFHCNDIEVVTLSTFVSETASDFCIPCQTSGSSSVRIQSNTRKTDNCQKNNFGFIKSGRIINLGVRRYISGFFVWRHSPFADSSSKRILQGKFII